MLGSTGYSRSNGYCRVADWSRNAVVVIRFRTMRPLAKQILTYLALVFTFSSLPEFVMIHAGHVGAGNGLVVTLVMWCPAVAALTTCWLFRIDLATLGWNWRPVKYQAWSYVIPILCALPVYVASWTMIPRSYAFSQFAASFGESFGFPQWPRAVTLLLAVPCLATAGVVDSMARALGEEIGWRGFLLPRLVQQAGFTWGCLLSGCIWAVWHYPALLFADYNSGTQPAFALTCFTLMVIADSYIMGWFRLKSGSLWTATMLHASHNLFIQAIFDRMTAPVGRALYVTTEFGFGLVLTIGACALYFWTRRGEVAGVAVPVQ
jgi:membrane protease YdiL (CAAX protease family)